MKFSELKLPSNKRFGLFFSFIFGIAFFYFYENSSFLLEISLLFIIIFLVIISFLAPNILLPLNKSWMYLGFILGKIVSPVVLGILYFMLITPVALFLKIHGRDELMLNKKFYNSFWKKKEPVEDFSKFFNDQF